MVDWQEYTVLSEPAKLLISYLLVISLVLCTCHLALLTLQYLGYDKFV